MSTFSLRETLFEVQPLSLRNRKLFFCLICFSAILTILQLDACAHPFFDDLRNPNVRLPNGEPLPPLFNFTPEGNDLPAPYAYGISLRILQSDSFLYAELKGASSELVQRLIPAHVKK